MLCLWCVYGVFPGNLWKSHNLNPLFFFPFGDVLFDDKLLLSQPPKCSVSKLCHPKSVQVGGLGSAISLSCCENCSDCLGVAGWKHVKTTVGWSSYYRNDYRFIHPITDEIPMITGLVFTGKFTPETPIFNGKNHGFRLRFSLKPTQSLWNPEMSWWLDSQWDDQSPPMSWHSPFQVPDFQRSGVPHPRATAQGLHERVSQGRFWSIPGARSDRFFYWLIFNCSVLQINETHTYSSHGTLLVVWNWESRKNGEWKPSNRHLPLWLW